MQQAYIGQNTISFVLTIDGVKVAETNRKTPATIGITKIQSKDTTQTLCNY